MCRLIKKEGAKIPTKCAWLIFSGRPLLLHLGGRFFFRAYFPPSHFFYENFFVNFSLQNHIFQELLAIFWFYLGIAHFPLFFVFESALKKKVLEGEIFARSFRPPFFYLALLFNYTVFRLWRDTLLLN